MKKVQLISKIDQGHYKAGDVMRTIKVKSSYNLQGLFLVFSRFEFIINKIS